MTSIETGISVYYLLLCDVYLLMFILKLNFGKWLRGSCHSAYALCIKMAGLTLAKDDKLTKSRNLTKTSSPNYQLYAQLQYNLNKLCYYNVTIMLKLYYNVTKDYLIIT